mgnify:FL=1
MARDYWAVLNAEEQKRANRFVKREHQTRFIAGRGILRSLLGQFLNVPPEQIEFDYLPQGKPILGAKHSVSNLQFNVSHSHDLALYAISTEDKQVGIDLEWLRPFPQVLSLARRFLTELEFADLVSLPPSQQERRFFQLWTAKEAYLKATGEGLTGLQTIELSMDETSQQWHIMKSETKVNFYSFTPTENFIATVATVENDGLNLRQQSDRAPDTSNRSKVVDRYSSVETLENQLIFRNWDE